MTEDLQLVEAVQALIDETTLITIFFIIYITMQIMTTDVIKPKLSKTTIYWLATLTYENGLTEQQMTNARDYFSKMEYCLAAHETGKNDTNDHIHAMFVHSKTKSDLIKRDIKKMVYGLKQRDKLNVHAIKVEKVKSLVGTIAYLNKDIVNSNWFVITGFSTTWIDQQLKDNFETRRFFHKWHTMKVDQAPHCIIEYCNLQNIAITNKDDFMKVVSEMATDGNINIRTWKRDIQWIYATVLAHFGDKSKMNDMLRDWMHFVS